ncbi:MAG TPA: hypothetical protein VFQ61_31750 [Polyangiaceae bacterium]|nr:hypothetical protein [Polyangiaceae bacterium]
MLRLVMQSTFLQQIGIHRVLGPLVAGFTLTLGVPASADVPRESEPPPPARASTRSKRYDETAQPKAAPRPGMWVDLEIDPIAYIAQGYSLHLGLRASHLRFDLGTFGLLMPEFVHGQAGFENRASGYGIKLDYYVRPEQSGFFFGLEGGTIQQQIVDEHTDTLVRVTSLAGGVRTGYEFPLPGGFYIKPWIGLGRRFGHEDVRVAGRNFHQSPWLVFPTVHLGYAFP